MLYQHYYTSPVHPTQPIISKSNQDNRGIKGSHILWWAKPPLLLAISLFSEQLGWWPPWSTPSISRQPGKYARLRATFSHTRLHFLCSPSLSSVRFNLVTQRDNDSKISQGPGSHSSSQMQKNIESQSGRNETGKNLFPLCVDSWSFWGCP